MKKQRTWTENELHILEELFPNTEVLIADIAKILNRNEVSIKQKAYSMGLFRPRRPRKPAEQIQYLKENFLHTSRKELEKVLGLSWKEIYRKAYNLGLRVSDRKEAQRKKMHKKHRKKAWTKEEIEFLRKNFRTMNPEELENRLERSWKTIYQKAYMIGLRRSDRNGSIDK